MTVHPWRTHKKTSSVSLFSHFQDAAARFGLTISLKKDKFSSSLQTVSLVARLSVITAGGTALPAVEKFCYLGRTLSADASSRTVKAS